MDGSRGRGRGSNPWNRGGRQNITSKKDVPKANLTAKLRFEEAQARLQASVQKHIKPDYESSSEEDELESDNILGSVLKSYSQLGGKSEDLGRTQRFLEDAFQSGAATCLICIASVKRNDAIWSCVECYSFFHLTCIQRWSKDSIAHQKQALEDVPRNTPIVNLCWACPKCRHEYDQQSTPKRYTCFCGQTEDPPYHPWLVPHSCGETCGRPLQPLCGHDCLLLCHPGPCPPCPKTVKCVCYCGKQPARLQRCSRKTWSCGTACGRMLQCGRHPCEEVCHPGDCPACPKTSKQLCQCGAQNMVRPCATPVWNCAKMCGKRLSCGHHHCERVCHQGKCGVCPLSESRTCPCGKAAFILPCTQDAPTCGDTCSRQLNCGAHICSRPCHRDKCGACLEVVTKSCRCGLHKKELPCQKEYLCETKCKRLKDCIRHPCNRKCCDGTCPPCEKICGRTLPCGNHKCVSVCHRGLCYPCPLNEQVKCRCGNTAITVPCGRKRKTKPPRCNRQCKIEADCHHPKRENHKCHFGDCPPCRQVCGKVRADCPHPCPALCHSAVWVRVDGDHKPAGPWEKVTPQLQMVDLPCPNCMVPVPVTCVGGHETCDWPCHRAKPSSCHRPCGRALSCGNHLCSLLCHTVTGAKDNVTSGSECEQCESGCTKPRPKGCSHPCTRPCHPDSCPPCSQMVRLPCHCALNQKYVRCGEWVLADQGQRVDMQSCGNQCPRNYPCSHRCRATCHPGDCPNPELCHKKVKIHCPCRRLRKEFPCDAVRAGQATLDCDIVCKQKKEEENKAKELERLKQQMEVERKNQEEVERFQRKFQQRKKHKERHQHSDEDSRSLVSRYWMLAVGTLGVLVVGYFLVQLEQ
uniref:NF-X1-type domain-containing protein n=1 Tax=Timema genevievae TaxID=629358 RepID=A0A7R9PMI6_TIMGE|nr:unnamed protein product [Timema genevievae]